MYSGPDISLSLALSSLSWTLSLILFLSLSHARLLLGLSPSLVHGGASIVGPSADGLLKHDSHPCSFSPWHMAGLMHPPLVTRAASTMRPSVGDLSAHDGRPCSFPHRHMVCVWWWGGMHRPLVTWVPPSTASSVDGGHGRGGDNGEAAALQHRFVAEQARVQAVHLHDSRQASARWSCSL